MTKALYEISADYLLAIENIQVDEETGEVTGYEELEAVADEFDIKAENISLFIKNEEAFALSIREEEKALADRRKQHENKANNLKNYLANQMLDIGKTKLETPKTKVSFRKSEQTIIEAEDLIPKEYIKEKITRTPDKTAIKNAIKSGQEVDGAYIETKQNIQIK